MIGSYNFVYASIGALVIGIIFIRFNSHLSDTAERARFALESLLSKLRQIQNKSDVSASIEKIDQIEAIIADNVNLTNAWREFRESLNFNKKTSGYYQTHSFRRFLDPDQFAADSIKQDFHERVPGWITSAGLSLTFLFIAIGLWNIGTSTSDFQKNAGPLVGSLAGKFVSSIFATILAAFFTYREHVAVDNTKKYCKEIVDIIDRCFQYRTSDQLLSEGIDTISDAMTINSGILLKLHERLGEIKESSEQTMVAIRQVSSDLSDSIEHAIKEANQTTNQQVVSVLNKISNNFVDSLQSGSKKYFESMYAILKDTSSELSNVYNNAVGFSSELTKHLDSTKIMVELYDDCHTKVGSSYESIERMSALISDASDRQISTFTPITEKIESILQSMQSISEASDASAQSANNIILQHRQTIETLTKSTYDVAHAIEKASSGYLDSCTSNRATISAITECFVKLADSLPAVIDEIKNGLGQLQTASTSELDLTLEKFAQTTKAQILEINKQIQLELEDVTARLHNVAIVPQIVKREAA